ncbi:MAG TPA: chemotaxis protein CheA [Allosphingosinicella sp.]|jgi:two-component system chemotaxis sensor kinase CheA
MDELINDFIAETREMLDALGGEIVAWEAAPHDKARLDAIFRFVHTVKGNSGFFDLPRIGALSHAAEDALAEVRAGRRAADGKLVSAVLAVIDRLGELVQALETGEPVASDDDSGLIAALSETSQDSAPDAEAAAAVAPVGTRAAMRTIRLPVELLDRMMSGISDLVLARNELSRQLRESAEAVQFEAAFDRVSGSIADLRDAITRTRMQRIDNLFSPLPRMVRDLSAETGKQVSLRIDGGDVELDREMIEMIRDPLTHIIRNAIDHGVESPAARAKAGKPAGGALSVSARQAGNQILIEIRDDGRGIDAEKLVRKAVSAGLLNADKAGRLTDAQKLALVFEPGLSTARAVTAISGRGVGMDVVRANIERIGGLVDVQSRKGEGVRLTLRVPLTLTIIPALTVAAAGQTYAIPRSAIEEIVRVKGDNVRVESVAGATVATVRGRRLAVASLAGILGFEATTVKEGSTLVVLKPAGGELYALLVDDLYDHEELVVKPAAPAVMAAGIYAGTTIADDGRPVLLLDPPGLAAVAGIAMDRADDIAAVPEAAEAKAGEAGLLFSTLSGGKRMVPLAVVERIEEVASSAIGLTAGRLHVTIGEAILPLEGCGGAVPNRKIHVLRLTDGGSEVAYGFDEVVDIIRQEGEVRPAAVAGETRGVMLIGGEQVELLDLHWLFARHSGAAPAAAERPLCALAEGDSFFDTILRPLVESAGYRVVPASSPEAEGAEVVVISAERDDAPPAHAAAKVLRIRSAPEPVEPGDQSIHRYDRDGLLAALGRRR